MLLAAAVALQAAIEGVVVNGTSGRPQPGAVVSLLVMGRQDHQPEARVTSDREGKFRFERDPESVALVQATHQGVNYSLVFQPGSPSTGLTLTVYDVTRSAGAAKVIQEVTILEPSGNELAVRNNIIWQNPGRVTFRDPAGGTLRFWAPEQAGTTLRVRATAPGGVPVEQKASPAGEPGVYKVDYPIRPGETSFEISYVIPFTTPGQFQGRTLQTEAPLRLATPEGVTLSGEGVELLGQEPRSRAMIYGVKGPEYKVTVQGAGMVGQDAGEPDESERLDQILPRVYGSVYQILGLTLAILALGFLLLYRRMGSGAGPRVSPGGKSHR